jgi:hypothetical protein
MIVTAQRYSITYQPGPAEICPGAPPVAGRCSYVCRRRDPGLPGAEQRAHGTASRAKTGRGRRTAPILRLVPQVSLPKRLALDWDAEEHLNKAVGLADVPSCAPSLA